MNSDARSEIKKVCNIETRYEEVQKEVYSHSTITFWSGGKQYTLRFKKIMDKVLPLFYSDLFIKENVGTEELREDLKRQILQAKKDDRGTQGGSNPGVGDQMHCMK